MPDNTDFLYPREVCAMLGIKPCSLGQLVTRGLIERAPRDTWYADGCPTYCRASVEARRDEMASRAHATVSAARAAQVAERRAAQALLLPSGEATRPVCVALYEATLALMETDAGDVWQIGEPERVSWLDAGDGGNESLEAWEAYMTAHYVWGWADDTVTIGRAGRAFWYEGADDVRVYGVVWSEEAT